MWIIVIKIGVYNEITKPRRPSGRQKGGRGNSFPRAPLGRPQSGRGVEDKSSRSGEEKKVTDSVTFFFVDQILRISNLAFIERLLQIQSLADILVRKQGME